jgi:hypothetical protein
MDIEPKATESEMKSTANRGPLAAVMVALLVAVALPIHAQESRPEPGLMWNRTGLPAVFPLQVKTSVGRDYVLLLSNAETNADVLAAYVVGGGFFRVLVPPGRFKVRFATGIRWEDENTMFGTEGETQIVEMPEPLTFEVKGLAVKQGHLIDLTGYAAGETAQIPVAPVLICQDVEVIPQAGLHSHKYWQYIPDQQMADHGRFLRIRARYC